MDIEKFKQTAPLVVLCQHGNKQAMREIYIKYHRNIFFTAKLMGTDTEYAMKQTAEIFLKMFASVDKLSDHMAFEQWFYSLAVSMCKIQPNEKTEQEDFGKKLPSFASVAFQAAKDRDKIGFEHSVSKLLENLLFSMEKESRVIFLYTYLACLETEQTALLEKSSAEQTEKCLEKISGFFYEKTEELKKYGLDITPFIKDPEMMLQHMAARSFVPESVHNAVSDGIGINVNPFVSDAPAEKKDEDAYKSRTKKVTTKPAEKKFFSKSDFILFVVILVVSALVFSGVKLYYRLKAENAAAKDNITQFQSENDEESESDE